MSPPSAADKTGLRSWAKTQPRCSPDEGTAVADHLVEWLSGCEPSRILVYMAMPGEVPVDGVVERLSGVHGFFVTRTPQRGPLTVHAHDGELERHPFGYLQPAVGAALVDPSEIDVVLAPGLCFDRKGGRVGWGKGYYDELLSRAFNARTVVGVTLMRFLVDCVPVEGHDRPMTHLATELGVMPVRR